jgi:uncharacterized protein YjcR
MAGDARRQRLGCGRPYRADIVERARELMEGTPLPFKVIAAALGIGTTTLHRWWKRHDWQRPARPAPGSGPESGPGWRAAPARSRSRRGRPIYADGVEAVRILVTGSLLPQKEIARRTGVSQERVSYWMRKRGWTRPPVPSHSKRFAAAGRDGVVAAQGDRRGRPYAASVRAEARALWEGTRLSTALIGARLGVHPVTVARWAKEEAWERPRGRLGARQLRGFFGSQLSGGRPAGSTQPRIRVL